MAESSFCEKWWKFQGELGQTWKLFQREMRQTWKFSCNINIAHSSEKSIFPFQLHSILRFSGSFSCHTESKLPWQCRRRQSWNEKIFLSNRHEKKKFFYSIPNNTARKFAGNDCWLKQEEMKRQQPENQNLIRRKISFVEVLRELLKTFTWGERGFINDANNLRSVQRTRSPRYCTIAWSLIIKLSRTWCHSLKI